jgi:hypothetical protein
VINRAKNLPNTKKYFREEFGMNGAIISTKKVSTSLIILAITCLLAGLVFVPAFADNAGLALRFDGNSDFVEFPYTDDVFGSGWKTEKTVSLWVKPDGTQSPCAVTIDPAPIGYCPSIFGDRPTYWGINIGYLNHLDQNRIWVWNYDGSSGSIADYIGVAYTPGEWVHISLVHKNGMLKAYKDGVEVGNVPSGPTLQPSGGGVRLSLGGVITDPANHWLFKGDIDEVSLWNRGLTASEIQANMYQDMPTDTKGWAAFYRMSNGSGNFLADDSGHGNGGTLYDGARGVPGSGEPAQWVTSDAFNVDGPSVTINQAATQSDPTSSSPINFTVVFSAPVTDFTSGDVSLSGTAGATEAVVTGSGATYNVAVSCMTNSGTVIASINAGMAHNSLGQPNHSSTSTDNTVTFNISNEGPSITINQATGQGDPTTSSPITFTVIFSDPVNDFTTGDVSLSGTAQATTAMVTGSGTTYSVAVSGMDRTGTVIASVPPGVAHDASNQPNSASTSSDNTIVFNEITFPAVTINQAPRQSDPTPVSPVHFQVIFSEGVEDFCTWEVNLSGSTAPGPLTVAITGSGTTYDVAISGMTGSGLVMAQIDAGVVTDATGNANLASSSTDNRVSYVYTDQQIYLPLAFR